MPLLTPKEVAERLGLSVTTLAIWRSRYPSRLPFLKLTNRAVRYEASDVEAFLASRMVGRKIGEN